MLSQSGKVAASTFAEVMTELSVLQKYFACLAKQFRVQFFLAKAYAWMHGGIALNKFYATKGF